MSKEEKEKSLQDFNLRRGLAEQALLSGYTNRTYHDRVDLSLIQDKSTDYFFLESVGCVLRELCNRGSETMEYDNVFYPSMPLLERESLEKHFAFSPLASGAAGTVEYASLAGSTTPILAVKKVKTCQAIADLHHEYFVGLYCLNELRMSVPSFCYTFAAYTSVEEENSIFSLVTEYVPGPVLIDARITYRDFLLVLLQLALGLKAAESHGFGHYDLNGRNVILRELPAVSGVSYALPGRTVLLHTQYIPVMIDFGFSRVRVESSERKDFGFPFPSLHKHEDKARPLADVFSLCMFFMRKRRSMWADFEPLYHFFDKYRGIGAAGAGVDLAKELKASDSFYSFPYRLEEKVDDLIGFLETVLGLPAVAVVASAITDSPVLDCRSSVRKQHRLRRRILEEYVAKTPPVKQTGDLIEDFRALKNTMLRMERVKELANDCNSIAVAAGKSGVGVGVDEGVVEAMEGLEKSLCEADGGDRTAIYAGMLREVKTWKTQIV